MSWRLEQGDAIEFCRSLASDSVDVVITDPPYDEHVHAASRRGATNYFDGVRPPRRAEICRTRDLGFEPLTPGVMQISAIEFARLARRWTLVFCSLEMIADWRKALEAAGLEYVRCQFWRRRGGAPQFTGDRPAAPGEAIVTAHRPGRKSWRGGGAQGFYDTPVVQNRGDGEDRVHTTQKPLRLLAELVRRFALDGPVLDPFAGSGTTGVAAIGAGLDFLGAERDPDCHAAAMRRLEAAEREGVQGDLFAGVE